MARELLAQAVTREVQEWLSEWSRLLGEGSRKRGVRNGLLPDVRFREQSEIFVNHADLNASAKSRYSVDQRHQRLVRQRTWTIDGGRVVEDDCEYRLSFPGELEQLLEGAGFTVVGMFDNMDLRDTDLSGERLYVAALYEIPRQTE